MGMWMMSTMESEKVFTEPKEVFPEFKAWKNVIVPMNKTEKVTVLPGKGCLELRFSRDGNPFIFYGKLDGFEGIYALLKEAKSCFTAALADLKAISAVLKKNVISVSFAQDAISYSYKSKEDESVVLETRFALEPISEEAFGPQDVAYQKDMKLEEHLLEKDILKLFLKDDDSITEERTHRKLFEFPVAKIWSLLDPSNTFIRFSSMENERRYVDIYSKKDGLELHQLFLTI